MEEFYAMPRLAARLDLAQEAMDILRGAADVEIAGIREDVRQQDGVTMHMVTVLDERGSQAIHKPCGNYITFDIPPLNEANAFRCVADMVATQLHALLPPLQGRTLLVIGLGNSGAVPDALGPQVVSLTYATRHLFITGTPPAGLERVCSLAPGVLGTSGIETAEIIRGVCDRLQPAAVIVVDALAAASVSRVGTTIQMTDSGIAPGSGVSGSKPGRTEISAASLGCPVVALGVPTVVDAAAIIKETLSALRAYWQGKAQPLPPEIDDDAREYTEAQLLAAFRGTLMVTPKDIDQLIADQAEIIAAAIAICAHPACTAENYQDFIK